MKNHKIAFSPVGFIVFIIQFVPNIFWKLFPPDNNPLLGNSSAYGALNILEWSLGVLIVALFVLVANKDEHVGKRKYFNLAAAMMVIYYAGWVLYLLGYASPWLILLALTATPPLYYLFCGLWLRNYIVVVPAILFLVVHLLINTMNFLLS